jgi:hypothetical protein
VINIQLHKTLCIRHRRSPRTEWIQCYTAILGLGTLLVKHINFKRLFRNQQFKNPDSNCAESTCICSPSGTLSCSPCKVTPYLECVFRNGGKDFISKDGCNSRSCSDDGTEVCTKKACVKLSPYEQCVKDHGGPSFKSKDGCNDCACGTDGLVSCTVRGCVENPVAYQQCLNEHGTGWFKSLDDCNDCTCGSDGMVSCTIKLAKV